MPRPNRSPKERPDLEGLDFDGAHEVSSFGMSSLRNYCAFAAVGIAVGIVAFVVDSAVETICRAKFDAVTQALRDGGSLGSAFIILVAICLSLGISSSLLVELVSPAAAGSGIPEAKAYLNGTNIPGFLELRTLFVKAVGAVFSVSAGLVIGKEGPLVHIGSILGAHITRLAPFSPRFSDFKSTLKTETLRRDLVSGGAAAGVSGAFGTAIGGILFSFEEASSFWSLKLTWRTYLTCLLTVATLWGLLSGKLTPPLSLD